MLKFKKSLGLIEMRGQHMGLFKVLDMDIVTYENYDVDPLYNEDLQWISKELRDKVPYLVRV